MGTDGDFPGLLASSDEPTCTVPRPATPALSLFPATIGRYRIVRLLGVGGMGVVYEAEQDQPRRKVALKVLKSSLPSPDLLWRFEQEAEVLGRLQHPGIARIYEASHAEAGGGAQPYFAMELIRGTPLLAYAEAHQLSTRQRLELMVQVSYAVQHAHQLGIIHRDLKPANVLVEESGQPKVLDFGVARITDREAHTTRQTEVGQIVGTLAYMSPEQVLGDPLPVDTRSDVYALGVILFELLAGRLPYKISRQWPEAAQMIREEEPTRLSSVSRTYRGDIETIVSKALEKDKARRYASAAEFAADLQRYLRDEPITARPPSTIYQLQKFARRHRGLVAGVATVFLVLVAGIVVSAWEASRALRAETTAQAVSDFLRNDLLSEAGASTQARPDTKPDPDLKVRTALDRAAMRISGKFATQPLVEASLRQTIGRTYKDLGLYPEAQRQLKRARDLRLRVLGESHPETLEAMNDLADSYESQSQYAQAEPLLTKVLELRRRVLGPEHPDTLRTANDLATLYVDQGQYARAESLLTKALVVEQRALGPEHPDTLSSMSDLAWLYCDQGQYARAEPLYNKVLEVRQRVLGPEHPDTLASMSNLADLYLQQGRYAQAEPLLVKALEVSRRTLGEEHKHTQTRMTSLAILYGKQGKYAQAEPLFSKVLEAQRRVLGKEHRDTLIAMNNLASLYLHQGQYARAEPLYAKALGISRRVLGEEHPDTLRLLSHLATLYKQQSKYAQAESLYTRELEVQRRVLGPEHQEVLSTMNSLADLYGEQGRYAQAEPLYTRVLELRRRVLGLEHPDTVNTMTSLGELRLRQHMYAEAEPLLVSGYEQVRQRSDAMSAYNRPQLERTGNRIVQLYRDWGKPAKAAEWRAKLSANQGSKP